LDRALGEGKIGLILAFEGAEPLGRDVSLVRIFYQLGLRMIGLTWNRANLYAQGLAEDTQAGLSAVGRQLLEMMQELNIILDLSHLSPTSFWSALKYYEGPTIASHCNAYALCNHPRNLTDEQIVAIAERGGLIGLNCVPRFVGGPDLAQGIVRHAEHLRNLVGLPFIALGPDFTDYLPLIPESPQQLLIDVGEEAHPDEVPADVTMLPALWRAFLESGWTTQDTAAIFADNALRYLRANLPGDSSIHDIHRPREKDEA
jgi:membrane dipeptidase